MSSPNQVRFHTRCIPREQLVPDHPVTRIINDNGLCDTFADDSLRFLRDLGVSVVETRAVWAMLEPKEGAWDFSSIEQAFEACDRHDMKLGLFAWPQHLPDWRLAKCSLKRLRCLEHDQDSRFLSFWEPETSEILGSFYDKLAEAFGDRAAMIYVGSAGCFGEPQYPQGVSHYRFFANSHNHIAFWCGDPLARADFAATMIRRHGTLGGVSRAWNHPLNSVADITLPAHKSNPAMWVDFARWYSESLTSFVDRVCAHASKAFPGTPRVMPVGTRGEPLIVGQDKWQIAQVAARYGMTCRWTGCGDYNDFAKTNLDARRLSSACRLLGCDFATESACFIAADNGMNCVYEQLANGVSMVHDDPGNFRRNATCFRDNRALYQGQQPKTRIAVFYSKLANYFVDGSWEPDFARQCVALRQRCDFEVLDEDMIAAGGLEHIDLLISFGGLVKEDGPSDTVRKWVRRGGTLLEDTTLLQSRHGFQTLAQASGTAAVEDFVAALQEALAHIDAVEGVPWGSLRSSCPQVSVTALGGELLVFNAASEPSTLQLGARSVQINPQSIISCSPAEEGL